MKSLREYNWQDWKRLRPVSHWMTTMHVNAVRELYMRRPQRGGDTGVADRIRGRNVLVTIAFDDSEAVGMQAPLIAHFVPDALHIIADISMNERSAAENAAAAAGSGAFYIRMPDNPWLRPDQASRTHGLAANWIWRNVLRPGRPKAFGFVDDDLFPTASDDPFAMLARQPAYGYLRVVGSRWFLSMTFSTYRFADVESLPLDFGQDWFNGLDTNGSNWKPLFRHLDRSNIEFMPTRFEPYRPGADPLIAPFQWCGVWLHEVGSTRREGHLELAADKRRRVREIVAPHLAQVRASAGAGAKPDPGATSLSTTQVAAVERQ